MELHTRPGRHQAFSCAQSAVVVVQRMLVQADGLQQLLGDLPQQLLAEIRQVLPEHVARLDSMENEPLDAKAQHTLLASTKYHVKSNV